MTALSEMALSEVDNLVRLVERAAARWPEKTAWVFDATGDRFTFAGVDIGSTRLALALTARGARPGDRVAVMLRNQPEFPLIWLALAKIGAVLVPVNINYRELDGAHVAAHSGARFAITAEEFVGLLTTIAPETKLERVLTVAELTHPASAVPTFSAVPEQPANLQYTSGTTGAPKGCALPHRYWTTLAAGLTTEFPSIGDDDVLLTAQPFHYIDPQWNVALGLASGATLVVLDRFHPSTFWANVVRDVRNDRDGRRHPDVPAGPRRTGRHRLHRQAVARPRGDDRRRGRQPVAPWRDRRTGDPRNRPDEFLL
jgi:crotonobetaine/carnitine-CoA ligase